MNDPKKLVPPCTCPPDRETLANEIHGVLDDKREFQLRPVDLPPPGRPATFDAGGELQGLVQKFKIDGESIYPDYEKPPSSAEEAVQTSPDAAGDLSAPDAAAAFVEAFVAVDRRAFTSTAEIMAAARVWCAENDLPTFHPRALAEQLKRRRGVQAHSNGQRRGWRGVKLR